jgi:hypothetical protein
MSGLMNGWKLRHESWKCKSETIAPKIPGGTFYAVRFIVSDNEAVWWQGGGRMDWREVVLKGGWPDFRGMFRP